MTKGEGVNNYSSNSDKSKNKATTKPEEKKIEKVVTNSATTKKRGFLKRVTDDLNVDDLKKNNARILVDVFLPDMKRAIHNFISSAIDSLFYPGESERGGRRSTASKVSYQRYYDRREESDRRYAYSSRRNQPDYDEIIFADRVDAELVLDSMEECIEEYGVVTVAELFELADIPNDNYTLEKFGWSSLSSAKVVRSRDGYFLKLPKPMAID